MDKILEYINQFEGTKNEWLEQLVTFMWEETQLQECFDCKMPTYRGHDFYIAFAIIVEDKGVLQFEDHDYLRVYNIKDEIFSSLSPLFAGKSGHSG